MPRAATQSALALVVALACLAARPADAQQAEAIRARAAQVLQDARYQRDLPTTAQPAEPDKPRAGGGAPVRREPANTDPRPPPRPPVALGQGVLWVLSGALLLAFVIWLIRQRRKTAVDVTLTDGSTTTAKPAGEAAGPTLRAPLTVADRALDLADAGRLDEAVHLLLLDALAGVTGRRPDPRTDAATSREILASDEVAEPAREPLGALVQAVEVSLFAGRPLERSEFDRALDHYRGLADAR